MSGPAFDALSQKRKRIAADLGELEQKVNTESMLAELALISHIISRHQVLTLSLLHSSQIYELETEYLANADCSSFGTCLKVRSTNIPFNHLTVIGRWSFLVLFNHLLGVDSFRYIRLYNSYLTIPLFSSLISIILQGFEGFLVSKNAQARNKNRTFRLEDRAFSLSSFTSEAEREQDRQRNMYAAEQAYGGRGKGNAPVYGGVKGVSGVVPSKRGY